MHESGDPAGQRSRHALQQRADPGQALFRQVGSRLISQALHVDPGDDLAGELVREGVLDRRVLDQRLHVGDIPAGVRDLVRRPHRHHRQRRQDAAHDDQQHRDRRPPASPAPDRLARRAARPGPPTRQRLRLAPFTGADRALDRLAHGPPTPITRAPACAHSRKPTCPATPHTGRDLGPPSTRQKAAGHHQGKQSTPIQRCPEQSSPARPGRSPDSSSPVFGLVYAAVPLHPDQARRNG